MIAGPYGSSTPNCPAVRHSWLVLRSGRIISGNDLSALSTEPGIRLWLRLSPVGSIPNRCRRRRTRARVHGFGELRNSSSRRHRVGIYPSVMAFKGAGWDAEEV